MALVGRGEMLSGYFGGTKWYDCIVMSLGLGSADYG